MNKKLVAGIIIGLSCVPLAASALSIDDLQQQIRELLAKVASLQAQLTTPAETSAPSTVGGYDGDTVTIEVPRICTVFSDRSLSIGSRNDDVRVLQEFLQGEGVLRAEATGYFGTATRDALRTWQLDNGVVARADANTGWGIAGPRTREAMLRRCGNAGVLTVSPERGTAPLTVVVTAKIGDEGPTRPSYVDGQDTLIDFGDGSERLWVRCDTAGSNQFGGTCATPVSYKHTYEKEGTYSVRLIQAGGMCIGGCPQKLLGTASVTVASVAIVDPGPHPENNPQCKAWYDGCNTCSRQSPGSPAMCTMMACMGAPEIAPYCKAYFDDTPRANKPPVISAFSGPVQLNLNEVGTWEVRASDPENGRLSYSISWGDEWAYRDGFAAFPATASIQQQTTFTHSYASAGRYTVRITVQDDAGQTAQSTATVQIAATAYCTKEYAPVCGRPSGCANTCAPGMYCAMMCQLHDPVTYGNECSMKAAGATLLHAGACTDSSGSIYY